MLLGGFGNQEERAPLSVYTTNRDIHDMRVKSVSLLLNDLVPVREAVPRLTRLPSAS